jgi:hypothetical protein
MDRIPEIANQWTIKGYGTTLQLGDGTYLLYHRDAPTSHNYHIHIGPTDDKKFGFAVLKNGGKHTKHYDGLTKYDYSTADWADFLWEDTGYSTYGKSGGKRHIPKHKKTNKRRKTKKQRKTRKRNSSGGFVFKYE